MITLHKEVLNIGIGAMNQVDILKEYKEEIMNDIVKESESIERCKAENWTDLLVSSKERMERLWEHWFTVANCIARIK